MKNNILNNYAIYLNTEKKRAPITIDAYILDLTVFFRFLRCSLDGLSLKHLLLLGIEHLTIAEIQLVDDSLLKNYFEYLKNERQNNEGTIRRKMIILKDFFDYLVSIYLLEDNPLKYLTIPKQKKQPSSPTLSLGQVNQLLNSIKGVNAQRDFAIIMLFLTAGLKRSEICTLQLSDDTGQFLKVHSQPVRYVPIINVCREALDCYKALRSSDPGISSSLFLSARHDGLSPRSITHIVQKHLKAAGLDVTKYSASSLRLTAGKMLADQNIDLKIIADILGYQSVASARHLQIKREDPDNLIAAMMSHPLNQE